MNLVDVGWIDGGGKKADRHVITMRRRDRVPVKRKDGWWLAILGECESFGLLVAVR